MRNGDIDWDVAVDSTIERAHQHAAGAPHQPPPPSEKGDPAGTNQDTQMWAELVVLLEEVVELAKL